MLTVTWSLRHCTLSSLFVTIVSDVVMVEVEPHAKETKILIWEIGHLGQKLLHHRLCEYEREHTEHVRTYS